MSAQHTQGRLKQGYTLATPQTRQWTGEQWEQNEAREKCLVFADFTPLDEGRGRKLVAACRQGPEDARRLVACWNACDGIPTDVLEERKVSEALWRQLTAQRDELLEALEGVMYWDNGKPEWDAARAAIAKVEGGAT